jgi:hypothetical protein
MDQHGAHRVIEGTKDTFSFTVLWRSIGAGEMKNDAMGSKQVVHGMVNKFCPIINLEAFNGRNKLCANVWDKFSKVLTNLRLMLKQKRPVKMSEIF